MGDQGLVPDHRQHRPNPKHVGRDVAQRIDHLGGEPHVGHLLLWGPEPERPVGPWIVHSRCRDGSSSALTTVAEGLDDVRVEVGVVELALRGGVGAADRVQEHAAGAPRRRLRRRPGRVP